jgi:hypothetical protein
LGFVPNISSNAVLALGISSKAADFLNIVPFIFSSTIGTANILWCAAKLLDFIPFVWILAALAGYISSIAANLQ